MSVVEKAQEHYRKADDLAWIQGNQEEALVEYRKALELYPDMAEAHWRIGQIYFFAEKPQLDIALKELMEAVRISPDWGEGYLWVANVLDKMGRLEEALSYYHDALRFQSDDPRIYFSLGYCLAKLERHKEAVGAFRQGLKLNPCYGEISARMKLADSLKEIGKLDEAINEWQIVANTKIVWDYEEHHSEKAKQMLRKHKGQ